MLQINLEKLYELDFRSNEAYKKIRTNIQLCNSNIKVICITSSQPNEGKSNVSFNLAVCISQIEKKVLFIDADLRKSVIIGRYKPDQEVLGLTNYLSGMNSLDDILYQTNIPNLDIIFTGPVPPNPVELLGGEIFVQLLGNMREEYDYIVIDTPPLGSVIDCVVVAEHCDGVVMVIEANAISYKFARSVKKQLERGNCRILGAILNKVEIKKGAYYYYGKKYNGYDNPYYAV